jgi:hypothetical protein
MRNDKASLSLVCGTHLVSRLEFFNSLSQQQKQAQA